MNNSKIYLITGNRKGIGRYLTEYYLKNNNVVIGCSRNETDLKSKNYHHYICDVANENDVVKLFRKIRKEFKHIDVLINNAGMASMNHTLTTPISTFDKLINTNLKGTFLFTREFGKLNRKTGGKIINFSTVAAPLNLEGEAIYASSKSAIEKFTKISSKELAEYKITVNCIGPTPIFTDLIKTVPKNKIEILTNQQAIKRLGEFEDVLNVINFFASEKSNFITGQIIYLGGI